VASMGNITAEEDADIESKAAAPGVEQRWVTENALLLELPADDSDDEAYGACAVPSATVEHASAAEAAPSAPVELVPAAEGEVSLVDAARLADAVARLGALFDGSSDTPAIARADPFLVLPTGGIGYKRAAIAQLNRMRPGERMSNDRLFRVRGVGAWQGEAGSSSATPGTGAAEGERSALTTSGVLSLGSDFAIAFEVGSGANASHEWWLGRVLALHRKAASGRSHGAVDAIELDGELQGVQVVPVWYEPKGGLAAQRARSRHIQCRHEEATRSSTSSACLVSTTQRRPTRTGSSISKASSRRLMRPCASPCLSVRALCARTARVARLRGAGASGSTRCHLHPQRSHRQLATVGRLPRSVLPHATSS